MNRYNRINLYKERCESFVQRTLSFLERLDFAADYSDELEQFCGKPIEGGCDGYDSASYTEDFSASLADEYMLLSDGIYSAVLTAFFHLWERDIKDLCKRMLRYKPVAEKDKEVTEKALQRFEFDKLKSLLIFWGANKSSFQEINLLRLVVNTIKHSTGSSSAELLTTNRKFYYKLSVLCNLQIDQCAEYDEPAALTIDDVRHFGESIGAFWNDLGEAINI